jgi:hypothetical protein
MRACTRTRQLCAGAVTRGHMQAYVMVGPLRPHSSERHAGARTKKGVSFRLLACDAMRWHRSVSELLPPSHESRTQELARVENEARLLTGRC